MLTLTEGLDDQGEVEESQKDDDEFIEAREDAAEALESAEEPLDLVALVGQGFIVRPGLPAIASGTNHREEAQVQSPWEGLFVLLGAVPEERQRCGQRSAAAQQWRPSTASEAWPGERANGRAVRASAATRGIWGVQPPRDFPIACGPFFLCHPDAPGRWASPVLRPRF